MKKLPPGKNQLGHNPFSSVSLEGPKKKHDDHGPNASVPGKSKEQIIPSEHWEKHYGMDLMKDTRTQAGMEWNAKKAKDRPCTHTKVNAEDH